MERIRKHIADLLDNGANIDGRALIEEAKMFWRYGLGFTDGDFDHEALVAIVIEEIAAFVGEPIERTDVPYLVSKPEMEAIAIKVGADTKAADLKAAIMTSAAIKPK